MLSSVIKCEREITDDTSREKKKALLIFLSRGAIFLSSIKLLSFSEWNVRGNVLFSFIRHTVTVKISANFKVFQGLYVILTDLQVRQIQGLPRCVYTLGKGIWVIWDVALETFNIPQRNRNCTYSWNLEANSNGKNVEIVVHLPCRHGISQEIKHTRCCEPLLRIQHQ